MHRFWFGELTSPTDPAEGKRDIWFKRSDETDRLCRENFAPYLDAARDTDWDLASLTREEQIGLVVLLDQIPRNIFRETGDAFACDAGARKVARELVNNGVDGFYLCERMFLFMPFMHSEDVADQDYCALLFAEQALAVPDDHKETFRGALDFATKHRDLIRKFGRFPHRNEMLGRESTEEETAFLEANGRGF
jgi:uncharacterized protein (DUF924 family)